MGTPVRNVLFIMCDQLRFDYLSCYGHPHLKTPHIDALAARGVRFNRAYVQSTICGPSRMSFYTGRYVRSHGSTWNGFPLRVGEPTLGDHLKEIGVRNVLIGKTHMRADTEGILRLGIDPKSVIGVHLSECGFEPYERHDGLHPHGYEPTRPPYDAYLRAQGFNSDNPWEEWANSAEGKDGEILSGWLMRYADKPARVAEEHSETPYITRRAMQFIDEAGEQPWCLHLSYIKPHWPYIVPAPYHDMYGPQHVLPAIRSEAEKRNAHPILDAYFKERFSAVFARDEVRERVIPAYMGLIKQIDDQMGVLFKFMQARGLFDNTMIVFTSDHGDYLGDHWLGEKEMFHEPSVKIPLIVYDPRAEADAARGTVSEALVESIDLAPTFVEFLGGSAKPHVMEGRSLAPLLAGQTPSAWRDYVISEYDYSLRRARLDLKVPVADCRMVMIMDRRWKYIHAEGFRPMLYDLERDAEEFHDLGADPAHAEIRARMHEAIFTWALKHHNRITISDTTIATRYGTEPKRGIRIGYWDEADIKSE